MLTAGQTLSPMKLPAVVTERGFRELEIGQIIAIGALVVTSFVATSLDNLLILVLLLGGTRRKLRVLAGFFASIAALMVVSALGYLLGEFLDAGLVGFLGLIPLCMGLHALWRPPTLEHTDAEAGLAGSGSGFVVSFSLMLGNSGDSLALFLPLLADTGSRYFPLLFVVWAVCALAWAGLACLIGSNRSLAELIERCGARLIPWLMIFVGSYILLDTGTDKLLG